MSSRRDIRRDNCSNDNRCTTVDVFSYRQARHKTVITVLCRYCRDKLCISYRHCKTIGREIPVLLNPFIDTFVELLDSSFTISWTLCSAICFNFIVDWIRIGGKNNKESIDRIEKRLRDYYRHEAHTKTKKKTKRRDSTVYSTMRQTSLSGFISLKNELY